MRVATLDLGTNTILCLVADVENGEVRGVLSDQARVVRLGQGVHQNRRFHPEALQRADECLADFAAEIRKYSVDRILAAATSASRDVANAAELLDIGRKHGIEIEVISGEREAECTYWGTVSGQLEGSVGIIDVGGGSTEFIVGDARGIRKKVSVDVGSVRMTEMFVSAHPIPPSELRVMEAHVAQKFAGVKQEFADARLKRVIAVAGTPTTLAALDMAKPFDAESVHGYELSLEKLREWKSRLASMSVSDRQKLSGMDAKRADVIVAGALVLEKAGDAFQADRLEVSVRGLRYGLAILAEKGD